ncbi:MAG: TrkH family potassium uptake protein [Oscillospiraceae bacterium]
MTLPICSKNGESLSFLSALFTATSATCVTGLIVADTFTQFTIIGQLCILLLIQLGGLGLVTLATFFNMIIRKKIGLKTLNVAKESVNSSTIFDIGHLLKVVFLATVIIECIGAILLAITFVPQFGKSGFFISIFLSVSAYCNAGFDILGFLGEYQSVVPFQSNPLVLCTIMGLIVAGGLGFVVWKDIWEYRKTKKLHLHSKIVLITTAILIVLGAILFALTEWKNYGTLGKMGFFDKITNSFFMSVTTRTAGFNSVPMENLHGITKLFMVVFMFIGAAPGSTGGGVKITTFVVLVMTVICVIRGKEETIVLGRTVEKSVVYKAMAVVSTALIAVIISFSAIYFTSHTGKNFSEIDSLFESVSAFATVGLSSGVTAYANAFARFVLILTMFIGRVGPVSLALSLALSKENKKIILPDAKILVG